ncbi:pectin lyase A precursor [Phyllosticta citriasiana]|uniref:pectin lyase n=1 Tax=Phyllosticta citriasiana TaxID=595635 RepID=A0ABR1KFW4_9PEZI
MRLALLPLVAALSSRVAAIGVVGTAEGFAKGVTGGGSATPVYPSTTDELVSYLEDDVARVIILNKEFDFKGTEGTVTENGCRPASNTCGTSGQDAINEADWCTNGNAGDGSTTISVTYDKAAILGILVGSNKSLVGEGTKGVIRGKGLRMVSGASNVIIQNIHITELNPQYIWGGDALTVNGADMIWIDHVKVSLIGRQMFVAGTQASNRVTISYCEFDGNTSWSASCDGHHYWSVYLLGSNDLITMKGNYLHHLSGRAPKVGSNTLLHFVNNYHYANTGHAFDVGSANANVVIEGNVFQNVKTVLLENKGKIFAAPSTSANSVCQSPLGHTCQVNAFGSSGTLTGTDTGFLSKFAGKNVASASAATAVSSASAGVGVIA